MIFPVARPAGDRSVEIAQDRQRSGLPTGPKPTGDSTEPARSTVGTEATAAELVQLTIRRAQLATAAEGCFGWDVPLRDFFVS